MTKPKSWTSKADHVHIGKDERYYIASNALGFHHSLGMTMHFKLSTVTRQEFLPIIQNSISDVAKLHPILWVYPVDVLQDTVSFSRLQTIKFSDVFTHRNRSTPFGPINQEDKELDTELERQHNIRFNFGKPHWRILLTRHFRQALEFSLSFIYHQALGDGLSGAAFMDGFTKALCRLDSSAVSDTWTAPPGPLLPTLEMLRASTALGEQQMSQQVGVDDYTQESCLRDKGPADLWLGDRPITNLPLYSRFRSFTFSSNTLQSLGHICSEGDDTVTSFLLTIIARTVFYLAAGRFQDLQSMCSFSVRHLFNNSIPSEAMGLFVTRFTRIHRQSDLVPIALSGVDYAHMDISWEMKRVNEDMRSALVKEVLKMAIPHTPAAHDKHSDMVAEIQRMAGIPRAISFELGVVGVIGAFDLPVFIHQGRMIYSASSSVIGPALKINAVGGPCGHLTLGLS